MAEKREKSDRGEPSERRVYVLPSELVQRVREYQEGNGIPSEVEAVRRLLDNALQMRDSVKSLLTKLRQKSANERDIRVLSRDVLAAHPLVRSISIDDVEGLIFRLNNGESGRIDSGLNTYVDESSSGHEFYWQLWPEPVKEGSFGRSSSAGAGAKKASHLDDDIPF